MSSGDIVYVGEQLSQEALRQEEGGRDRSILVLLFFLSLFGCPSALVHKEVYCESIIQWLAPGHTASQW